ncbi:MAG: BolA family transcriptional regulator [Gammaproteobacteria bacterium CG11_big_fil_rev_8_21_14_0_20_46_22]|nr:MAG: BolA family transcriptional regulator [Gammaproteobacteria bacterium CG12_big_fil_rev_8_21_14_0_65_46_12]PIR10906.1 MAG: BolA family transcriptional regulator [Gammaproteobacteria bacterium CG11_big_fil_rev_8_21_14_0_20_46_22]
MTPAERKQYIETELTTHLAPSVLKVMDESHLHAGHAGAQSGASHFAIEIAAKVFEGKTRVAAHRMIYALLADVIPHEIHALRIVMVHQGT